MITSWSWPGRAAPPDAIFRWTGE